MSEFPERIVYVEDENDLRFIMREALEASGYQGALVTCGTGEEFLNRVRELQPDLVLLDLKMPNMDGPAVIEQLMRDPDQERLRIIFVTGSNKVEMEKKYERIKVIGVLHKPVKVDSVYQEIQALWKASIDAEKDKIINNES